MEVKDLSELSGGELMEVVETLRRQSATYHWDYAEYKAAMQPVIDAMNKKGRLVAKKHGKRFTDFTFARLR